MAIKVVTTVDACIPHLRTLAGPPHIAGAIVTIGIDPVDTMSRRARSHIVKKRFKCLEIWADLNTACAVVFITGVLWIQAAAFHRLPNPIFARFPGTMFLISRLGGFGLEATTGSSVAAPKMISTDQGILKATSTDTDPLNPPVIGIRPALEHREKTEYLSGNVVHSGAGSTRDCVPTTQIIAVADNFSATCALAMPSCLTPRSVCCTGEDIQIAECAPYQVVQVIDLFAFLAGRSVSGHEITLVDQPLATAGTTAKPTGASSGTFRTPT